MRLTEDERAALERYRHGRYGGSLNAAELSRRVDADILAQSLTRLFPVRTYGDLVIRWDDEITPERLVACCWVEDGHDLILASRAFILCRFSSGIFVCHDIARGIDQAVYPIPRIMLHAWHLTGRCGIEEGGK